MPEPAPETRETGENEANLEGDALDLPGLVGRADVDGLLALAKAYRSGTAPGGRDMKRCLEAYRAAAQLGSADAEYAAALFSMSGGVVPQDFKEGTTRLRVAAEKGSVPAKVYLGNLYELGIHYKADPEKADVWYRNAARGALVASEPGSADWAAELADLGCVRYVLAKIDAGGMTPEEEARLLQRARAHGYGLRAKEDPAAVNPADRPTFLDALASRDSKVEPRSADPAGVRPDPTTGAADRAPASPSKERPQVSKPTGSTGPTRATLGLGAFGYAILFVLTGLGAGYAAALGAHEVVARGAALPLLGHRTDLVFPIAVGLFGVLPTWLVYRLGTVLKALVLGAATGGLGWVLWGTGQAALRTERPLQSLAFGVAGFLSGLLVLGLLGGTKKQPPRLPRHPSG